MSNTYLDHFQYLRSPSGLEALTLLGNSARLASLHALGATTLTITPATSVDLKQFDQITIFDGPNSEVVIVNADTNQPATSIPLVVGTQFQHAANTPLCSDGVLGSLADQIVDASAWLEADFTYQSLFQSTYTGEILPLPSMQASFDNQHMLLFRPKHFPVTAINSIVLQVQQNQTLTIDPTQAFIDSNQQIVRVPTLNITGPSSQVVWPMQRMNRYANAWITISYTAGYAQTALPADIKDAAVLLTSAILSRRQNPTGADSIVLGHKALVAVLRGDQSGEGLLVKEARRKLARYKVRTI